jgi:hypothetical protein
MHHSREDSVWRTLAVAFGDGLAFGAGVNLSRRAVQITAGKPTTHSQPLAERLSAIEQRIEHARAAGTLHSLPALDVRVTELSARFEQALAQHEVQIKIQLEGLQERGSQMAQDLAGQMAGLRVEMVSLHKEFAEDISRLIDVQIETGIAARLESFEASMREAIQEEVRRASAAVIADFERRVENRDRGMLEMVLALGQTCLETAERMSPPVHGGAGSAMSATAIQPAGEVGLPSFAQSDPPKGAFRIPFVSSFFVITCGLLALHLFAG